MQMKSGGNDTNENNDQSYISFKSAQFNDSLLLSNIYFTRNCFFNKQDLMVMWNL